MMRISKRLWSSKAVASQRRRPPAHQQIPLQMQDIRFPTASTIIPTTMPRSGKNPPPEGARIRRPPTSNPQHSERTETTPHVVVITVLKTLFRGHTLRFDWLSQVIGWIGRKTDRPGAASSRVEWIAASNVVCPHQSPEQQGRAPRQDRIRQGCDGMRPLQAQSRDGHKQRRRAVGERSAPA
jgi:hypothetical protein